MAFRKKAFRILEHKPDLLIIPECEHPDKLKFEQGQPIPTDILWHGANKNKGLAVFSYSDFRLKLLDSHDPEIKTILPIAVTSKRGNFVLLAIWAYNPSDRDYNYIGQVWKAIHRYENLLKKKSVILAGDFNSNAIWDKLNRKTNHSMVLEKLASLNISSIYHKYLNMSQGLELHPTFFLYRHQDKPYHLDYCFASVDFINKLESMEIGTYDQWSAYSDHCPLFATFRLQT